MEEIMIIILIAILGLIMGSFFACMGYRIPNKVKITTPGSFCPNCGKSLKWYMNIPVLSFVFLKGKCAYCKKPINYIYPFIELATSILFLCNYMLFGFTMEFYISTVLVSALMITIVSDFMYYYISDRVLVISGVAIIVILSIFTDFNEVFVKILCGACIFLVMLGIKALGNKMFKKESLGDGDIKLMGVIGVALGLLNSFMALFMAAFIGLIYSVLAQSKNKEGIIPFGPFLLIGALIVIYFNSIIEPFIWNLVNI